MPRLTLPLLHSLTPPAPSQARRSLHFTPRSNPVLGEEGALIGGGQTVRPRCGGEGDPVAVRGGSASAPAPDRRPVPLRLLLCYFARTASPPAARRCSVRRRRSAPPGPLPPLPPRKVIPGMKVSGCPAPPPTHQPSPTGGELLDTAGNTPETTPTPH